jgi:DNA-binding transcriptional MerR regulator
MNPCPALTLEPGPGFTVTDVAIRTISKAAADAGVSPDTLRYYERVGLLAPPERSASGYRVYDASTAERVRLIKGAQGLGLSLDSIRDLLTMLDRGACPCGHTRELAEQRVTEIDAEILRLQGLRNDLLALADGLDDCPNAPAGLCWCQTVLTQKGRCPHA